MRIRLADGRYLGYAELGDSRGVPIIHHHGMPGSRLDHEGAFEMYRKLGVRVITPDRPGYGLSDPLHDGSLTDWPRDIAELADALDIGRFGITALSGGGIYALACAALLPDRVTGVALTSCPAPMDWPGAMVAMKRGTRFGVWVGLHAPWLLAVATGALAGPIRQFPRFFVAEATRNNSPVDRRWLKQTVVKAGETESIKEAFRQGGAGYVRDIKLLSRPWGFAPETIKVPVSLWYGDRDNIMPPSHSVYLAGKISGSLLVLCPGEGHMLMWNHLAEILSSAAAPGLAAAQL